MMTMRKVVVFLVLWLPLQLLAAIDTYDFASEANQKRYLQLVEELRCPKCQNQNLNGSNSPIAADLRRELHRLVEAGQSDDEIKAFMVKRYGNFVLYRPPVDKNTLVLWGLPAVMGILALLVVLRFRSRLEKVDRHLPLSDSEREQLARLLDRYPS